MIFDLRGKRKRVVQVVYAGLAVLFAISFIGFGVGSGNGVGGIFDQLFGSGSSSPATDPQLQEEIDSANSTLATNPKDEHALVQLAEASYLAGNSKQTGTGSISADAAPLFDQARSAWERYLALDPKKPNDSVASEMLGLYQTQFAAAVQSSSPDIPGLRRLLNGAVKTAAIVAAAQPSASSYGNLAQLAYLAGDTKQGDQAARQALDKSSSATKQSTQQFVSAAKKTGVSFQKSLAKYEKQSQTTPSQAFSNPLSSGGLSGGTVPPGGTAPAPSGP
jgi:hypothetical protein